MKTSKEKVMISACMAAGLLTEAQIVEVRRQQTHLPLFEALIAQKLITGEMMTQAWAAYHGMEYFTLSSVRKIPRETLDLLPPKVALYYQALPLPIDRNQPVIAIADPSNLCTLDALKSFLESDPQFVCVDSDQLHQALLHYYGNTEDIPSLLHKDQEIHPQKNHSAHLEKQEAPLIQMVSTLLLKAYEYRASDIHLEPMAHRFRVRFRIDGELQEIEDLPSLLHTALINRLKIMSGSMNIAEKRIPQDGRFQLPLKGNSLDFRLSTIPTIHGESAVIRILDKSTLVFGLSDLGFWKDHQTQLESLMKTSNGMILITGPTGSGKTTTLYACLNSLHTSDRKIITVEDPIEYQILGINQVPVNLATGMTFPVALRAILRQAPNILMIGEIRDYETANIAMQASLTGHLIFSTLHTNDAPSAITRLVDMGIQPFLISSSVRAVMAQRLVRRLCPYCKRPKKLSLYECNLLNIPPDYSGEPMIAVGCNVCHATGYQGRIGIFEIFVLDDEVCRRIPASISPLELRCYARQSGMQTLTEDGVRKIFAGLTTAQEVIASTLRENSLIYGSQTCN